MWWFSEETVTSNDYILKRSAIWPLLPLPSMPVNFNCSKPRIFLTFFFVSLFEDSTIRPIYKTRCQTGLYTSGFLRNTVAQAVLPNLSGTKREGVGVVYIRLEAALVSPCGQSHALIVYSVCLCCGQAKSELYHSDRKWLQKDLCWNTTQWIAYACHHDTTRGQEWAVVVVIRLLRIDTSPP